MEGQRQPKLVETMVGWIHPQVMVFLGKVMNPMTQKTERDLKTARFMIDLLAELEEKTEGRLEEHEKTMLQKSLTELRLNYLDEMSKPEPEVTEDEPAAKLDEEAPKEATAEEGDAAKETESEEKTTS